MWLINVQSPDRQTSLPGERTEPHTFLTRARLPVRTAAGQGTRPGATLPSMAQVTTRTRHRRAWVRIFFGGLVLWLASVLVTFVTENSNLVPTVILVGSFLVPVTFVAYAFEHRASDTLTEHTIFVG